MFITRCSVWTLFIITSSILHGVKPSIVRAAIWDGGGNDPYWSTAENWVGDIAPLNDGTADVSFNSNFNPSPENLVPWSIHSLNLDLNVWGGITLKGQPLTLGAGGLTTSPGAALGFNSTQIHNDIHLSSPQLWNIVRPSFTLLGNLSADGHHLTIETLYDTSILGAANFSGGLSKLGTGKLYLESMPGLAGPVNLYEGTLSLPGPVSSTITLDGGTLELRGDHDIQSLIETGSSGGNLVWHEQSAITFGGTKVLDMNGLQLSGTLRLGATQLSTIASSATIIPDSITTTLYFGAGNGTLSVDFVVADSSAGATHLEFDGSGTTKLNALNTYTGLTTVNNGKVEVHSGSALGSAFIPTIVTGGRVDIFTNTDEPFIVYGGSVNAQTQTDSSFVLSGGTVSLKNSDIQPVIGNDLEVLGDGTLHYQLGRSNVIGTATGAINLHNDAVLTIGSTLGSNNIVELHGPVQGQGSLNFDFSGRTIEVHTSMAHTGDTIISGKTDSATVLTKGVAFEATQSFGGNLIIDGGILFNNAPNTVPNLILNSGWLLGSSPLTIGQPVMELTGGHINIPGGLVGISEFVKTGFSRAELLDFGTVISPAVRAEQGSLTIGAAAGAAVNGPVYISDPAVPVEIRVKGNQTIAADLNLNNGTGISYSGALTGNGYNYLNGTIDLGDNGSYIGGITTHCCGEDIHTLTISGQITGGDLTKVGTNWLALRGGAHDYTGSTIVNQGALYLRGDAHLSTTDSIQIHGSGRFILDSAFITHNQDQVADNIPIFMDNGRIEMVSYGSTGFGDPTLDETFGPLVITAGTGIVLTGQQKYTGGNIFHQTMTFAELYRQPVSTIVFESDYGFIGTPNDSHVYFTHAPALTNGIIGPWAIVMTSNYNSTDFATYDPVNGITTLSPTGRPSDINTATATDNLRLEAAAIMNADTTVYTLFAAKNVDLGGNKLTIDSGGLLLGDNYDAPTISNGRIAAGPGSSELIVHIAYIGDEAGIIGADIVDSTQGPTDLVIARAWSENEDNYIKLSGNNTYAGKTYISAGAGVRLLSPDAAPAGGDVVVNGGLYHLYQGAGDVILGEFTLRNNGEFWSYRDLGIHADTIHAESGAIEGNLRGNSPIVKTTSGILFIRHAHGDNTDSTNQDYWGSIDIQNGIILVEPLHGLGSGLVTIRRGGRLVLDPEAGTTTPIVHGQIVLDGGELGVGSNCARVTFGGPIEVVADSHVLTFNGMAGTNYRSVNVPIMFDAKDVIFADDTSLAPDVSLETWGDGTLIITGNLFMNSGSSVSGNVLVEPASGRQVSGSGTIKGDLVIGDGAILSPGAGIGRLTIDGAYTQETGGLLEVEVDGGHGVPGDYHDVVQINGRTSLAGGLKVTLADGFTPTTGDHFIVLIADSIVGQFDGYDLPVLDDALEWDITIDGTQLVLNVTGAILGDLDGNGFVGITDLNIVLGNWNQGVTPGDPLFGDPTGDGFVGIEDLNYVLGSWNSGRLPPPQVPVPEPLSAILLLCMATGLLRRARCV